MENDTSKQQFYIAVNGQETGPFTIDQLKEQGVRRDALVWTDGLKQWVKAEDMPILQNILRSVPPPLLIEKHKEQEKQTPIKPDRYFGYKLARRRERFLAFLIQFFLYLVFIMIVFGTSITEEQNFTVIGIILDVAIAAFWGAVFYSFWGCNIGHKIVGLQVISSVSGEVQKNGYSGAIREGMKMLFSMVIIPTIWLLWDDDRQNLYDKITNTYVVKIAAVNKH